ncbi:MAG: iron donor protein CyaY [Sutterellaceae bacterium]|nr:iron donor protein CyaY [Burkholderiaceae bacterium]MCX7901716.1 iron donor protein CyaY [Burkholderiaceae bacterium]MDW8430108.1 iron donor protein CyaY [Sutterellaceae bacterium]
MTDSEFLTLAEVALRDIERALEATGIDVEMERSGNVLTIELAAGGKIVINLQEPMRQIWVAAKSGASHYAYRDGAWRDTRDGRELFAALSTIVSAQAGTPVVLRSR